MDPLDSHGRLWYLWSPAHFFCKCSAGLRVLSHPPDAPTELFSKPGQGDKYASARSSLSLACGHSGGCLITTTTIIIITVIQLEPFWVFLSLHLWTEGKGVKRREWVGIGPKPCRALAGCHPPLCLLSPIPGLLCLLWRQCLLGPQPPACCHSAQPRPDLDFTPSLPFRKEEAEAPG